MEKGTQVIPILIKPCDWENSNIGKLFAPNRGKSISLDQELFLRNIIKENTAIERAAWWGSHHQRNEGETIPLTLLV